MRKYIFISYILFLSCGLVPVPPKAGQFCNPMSEKLPCIQVDFDKKIIFMGNKAYPLNSKSIIEYSFIDDRKNIVNLNVLHKHRVELVYPDKSNFFIRVKFKK